MSSNRISNSQEVMEINWLLHSIPLNSYLFNLNAVVNRGGIDRVANMGSVSMTKVTIISTW